MKRFISSIGALLCLLFALFSTIASAGAATITLDKEDFPPGAFALVYAEGFAAGEAVQLTVVHLNSPEDPSETWIEYADKDGAFESFWFVTADSLGDTLLLTAVGQTSGLVAEKIFTDAAAVGAFTSSLSPNNALNPGTYNVTITINNVNTGSNATSDDLHAVQIDVPAGASVTWGAVTAVNASNGALSWDQTANVIVAGTTYGFTRANNAGTKVPPGGKVTVSATITVYQASCFAVRAYGNNGYGAGFSGNGTVSVCFGVTNPGLPPAFSACPGDLSANATAGCATAVSYTATASGLPSPTLSYSFSGATTGSGSGTGSGSSFNVGATTVTLTASNATGSSTCTFTVTVSDTEAPSITSIPAAGSASADASCQAVIPDVATGTVAADNCTAAGSLAITQSPAAGTTVGLGEHIIVVTVTDAAGNSVTGSTTFTVDDTTGPSLSLTAPAGASADANCQAAVPAVAHSSSDACGSVTVTQSPTAGTLVGLGATTITVTATDAAGNVTTQTTSFAVSDATAPSLSVTAPAGASANANCQAAVPAVAYTAADNCSEVTVTQSPAAGDLVALGVTTITVTATDAAGNVTTQATTFTVSDTTAPSLTLTAPAAASANANCEAAIPAVAYVAADNCSEVSVAQSPAAGDVAGLGSYTITVTATDAAGNVTTDSVTFTVSDTTAPSLSITAPAPVLADANCQATIPAVVFAAADNCSETTVTQSPAAGEAAGLGTYTITLTARDAAGNVTTESTTFTVSDGTAPSLSLTAPAGASANSNCQAAVPLVAYTATDNCSGVAVTQSPAAGDLVGLGVTTITVTATDEAGNVTTQTTTFAVSDTTAPSLSLTAPAGASANASCQAAVPAVAYVADDNCSDVTVTQSPAAGELVGLGTHIITVTAKDEAGNVTIETTSFTVNDTTAPEITVPANITQNTDAGVCSAVVTFNVSATDNCSTATVTASPASGSEFAKGATIVTVTAVDEAGNESTTSFTVTVKDGEAPSISAPSDVGVGTDAGLCSATGVALGSPVTSDNCPEALTVSNNAPAVFLKGTTLVTWTATDAAGNSSSATQIVVVSDTEPPVLNVAAASASANANCLAVVPMVYVASDNCEVTVTQTPAAGSLVGVGEHTIFVSATDGVNTINASTTLTVSDTTAPNVVTKNAIVQLVNGAASITVADIDNGSSDNCGIVSLTLSRTAFGCSDVGFQTVTLTATDAAGNQSSATAQVQVLSQVSEVTGRDSIYTGEQSFWTTSSTSSTASLALSATVRTECGDITLAKVRFYVADKPEGPWTAVTGELNVGPVANAIDRGTGTASATVQYNIGNNNAVTLYVRVGIGGCFLPANGAHTIAPISVSKPGTGRTIGALKLSNTAPTPVASGLLATDNSGAALPGKAEVAMGVWYNRSGANPQGGISGIICAGNRTYAYKSTAISTFSVQAGKATFSGKCVLKDITDPNNPISLDSGNLMQFSVTDGNPDKAALSIQRSSGLGGGLWYSSGWDRTKTVEKTVATGGMTIAP